MIRSERPAETRTTGRQREQRQREIRETEREERQREKRDTEREKRDRERDERKWNRGDRDREERQRVRRTEKVWGWLLN